MFKDLFTGNQKKSKLKLTEANKFQSQINKQLTNQYRLYEDTPYPSLQPSQHQSQKLLIKQKQNICLRKSILVSKKQSNLQDLILLKKIVFEGSISNQQKAQLQEYLQKDNINIDRSNSLIKKNFSLPKLQLEQKKTKKFQILPKVHKERTITKLTQDILLIKLLQKMSQHVILRKDGQFIYISQKELLKFLNFLISLLKCQKEDKVAQVFQKFPYYSFLKDSVLELYRYYDKSNESLDTRSLGTTLSTFVSVSVSKAKSNIILRKKEKNQKTKKNEIDMNKTSVSLQFKDSEVVNKQAQISVDQQKIQAQRHMNLI